MEIFPSTHTDDKTHPRAPRHPIALKSTVEQVSGETGDDYPAVVAMLEDGRRVIECRGRIQWIIQKRAGEHWHSEYFCRTKEGLLLYAGSAPELLALPDYFKETA